MRVVGVFVGAMLGLAAGTLRCATLHLLRCSGLCSMPVKAAEGAAEHAWLSA